MPAALMPFIMPDGARLTSLLDSPVDRADARSKAKKTRSGRTARGDLWLEPRNDHEAQELAAASKLGSRRRARWMNEQLLRRMAGPMTAQDMNELFNPPPFGEVKRSALSTALSQDSQLWDRLRHIDMDKEAKLLTRWQQHLAGAKPKPRPPKSCTELTCAAGALDAWHRIGSKSRLALKKIALETVHGFEEAVTQFIAGGEAELKLAVPCAFTRCAVHGLCAYYSLTSSTTGGSPDSRTITIRSAAADAPFTIPASADTASPPTPAGPQQAPGAAAAPSDAGVPTRGDLQPGAQQPPTEASGPRAVSQRTSSAAGTAATERGSTAAATTEELVDLQQWYSGFRVVDILLLHQEPGFKKANLDAAALEAFRREHLPDWVTGMESPRARSSTQRWPQSDPHFAVS